MNFRKNILSLLLFATLALGAQAQGNLQFNQVIELSFTGAPLVQCCARNYVQIASQINNIPVGKVWKIESFSANITKGTYVTSSHTLLANNNSPPMVYIDNALVSASQTSGGWVVPKQIYWLHEGNHNFSLWMPQVDVAVPFTVTASFTVIEFNVVP